jgi:hypothetical protein
MCFKEEQDRGTSQKGEGYPTDISVRKADDARSTFNDAASHIAWEDS